MIFIACLSAAIIGVKKQKTAAGYYLAATIMFFVMASIMALSAGNIIDNMLANATVLTAEKIMITLR
ncbi:hypothetical protein CMT41_07950 [Colwellia sp. MT41]|nr:hypothetical protein CMT41_07950 [Colwellia sp. MT41]